MAAFLRALPFKNPCDKASLPRIKVGKTEETRRYLFLSLQKLVTGEPLKLNWKTRI